ncbi:YHYH protein [Wenyingzhuangia sp. IMCC45467]
MHFIQNPIILFFIVFFCFIACDDNTVSSEDDIEVIDDQEDDPDNTSNETTLHTAFAEFSKDISIVLLDDDTVSIETDGLPNHTSPYWSPTHDLYASPTVATESHMSPGYIDDFNGTYVLQVSTHPQKAAQTTSTSLGAIGIAVSGGVIYNQNEAGNVQITNNVASGLDYSGAHTGPTSYHYHFEPTAFTNDDASLVGIIADGFFLYGRKCTSVGTYPADLDASNGHISDTKHNADGEYHYHIGNTTIYNKYYVNFTGDYQGTPYNISGGNAGGGPGGR